MGALVSRTRKGAKAYVLRPFKRRGYFLTQEEYRERNPTIFDKIASGKYTEEAVEKMKLKRRDDFLALRRQTLAKVKDPGTRTAIMKNFFTSHKPPKRTRVNLPHKAWDVAGQTGAGVGSGRLGGVAGAGVPAGMSAQARVVSMDDAPVGALPDPRDIALGRAAGGGGRERRHDVLGGGRADEREEEREPQRREHVHHRRRARQRAVVDLVVRQLRVRVVERAVVDAEARVDDGRPGEVSGDELAAARVRVDDGAVGLHEIAQLHAVEQGERHLRGSGSLRRAAARTCGRPTTALRGARHSSRPVAASRMMAPPQPGGAALQHAQPAMEVLAGQVATELSPAASVSVCAPASASASASH